MPSNEKYNKGKLKKKLAAGVIAGVMAVNTSPAIAAITDYETEKDNTYIPATPVQEISNSYADDFPLDEVEFIDIPDNLVPLDEGLDQETDGGIVSISQDIVPLADIPLVDVPLGDLPQTGVNGIGSNWLLLGFSLSGLLLAIRGKKS